MSKKIISRANKEVLRKGLEKALALIKAQQIEIGHKAASVAVLKAVSAWDKEGDVNLTGNTRSGFCSAVYWDGKIQYPIHTYNLEAGFNGPIASYAYVGRKGFRKYGDSHYIGGSKDPYVMDYTEEYLHFQPTNHGGFAREDTIRFLIEHKPNVKGLAVITANVSPYANFLVQERDLDILVSESHSNKIREKISFASSSVAKI